MTRHDDKTGWTSGVALGLWLAATHAVLAAFALGPRGEPLDVAAVAAALLLAGAVGVWPAVLAASAANLLLAADFALADAVGMPLRLDDLRDFDPALLASSLGAEATRAGILFAIVAGCAAPVAAFSRRLRPLWLAGPALVAVAALALGPVRPLEARHPVVTVVADAFGAGAPTDDGVDLHALRFGEPSPMPAEAVAAAEALRRLDRPDIVLLVLESVGARQLLAEGPPPAAIAPNLAALYGRALVFDSVYPPQPGTTKSNVAMNTGGLAPTWAGSEAVAAAEWRRPLLASELKRAGYRTGLFAAADLGYLDLGRFLERAGYDTFFDPGRHPEFLERHRLNSWGAADHAVVDEALGWLSRLPAGEPFFLQFLTNSPHHPYTVPPGRAAAAGDDRRDRYRAALRYVDAEIGRLVAGIAARGRARPTVFVITGDHGEAFGLEHAGNVAHRAHLYEENVRSFVIVAAPDVLAAPVVASRPSSNGEIMPLVLRLAGRASATPAQDPLSPDYRQGLVFFHLDNHPGSWGLRDGRWKFIERRWGDGPELYDLEADAGEAVSLAAERPEQVALYRRLAGSWFARQSRAFAAAAALEPAAADPRALRRSGLAEVVPGRLAPDGGDVRFVAQPRIGTGEHAAVLTRWNPFPEPRTLAVTLTAPDGRRFEQRMELPARAATRLIRIPDAVPGTWRVEAGLEGGETLAAVLEVVSEGVAPQPLPELLEVAVLASAGGDLAPTDRLSPDGGFKVRTRWLETMRERRFEVVLVSPDGVGHALDAELAGGLTEHLLGVRPPERLGLGRWQVLVAVDGRVLGATAVVVAERPEGR